MVSRVWYLEGRKEGRTVSKEGKEGKGGRNGREGKGSEGE
jgi:hypothetical protein